MAGLKRSRWPTCRMRPCRAARSTSARPPRGVSVIGFSTRTSMPCSSSADGDGEVGRRRHGDAGAVDAAEEILDPADRRRADLAPMAAARSASASTTPTSSTPGRLSRTSRRGTRRGNRRRRRRRGSRQASARTPTSDRDRRPAAAASSASRSRSSVRPASSASTAMPASRHDARSSPVRRRARRSAGPGSAC